MKKKKTKTQKSSAVKIKASIIKSSRASKRRNSNSIKNGAIIMFFAIVLLFTIAIMQEQQTSIQNAQTIPSTSPGIPLTIDPSSITPTHVCSGPDQGICTSPAISNTSINQSLPPNVTVTIPLSSISPAAN